MSEAFRADPVQGPLSGMSERRMSQIVSQSSSLDQVLIQAQGLGNGPGVLGDLQRMSHPGPVMVPVRIQKDLGLVLEPAEGLAVQNTVPVPLEDRPDIALGFLPGPAFGLIGKAGLGGQDLMFSGFHFFSDGHNTAASALSLHKNSCS